MYKSVMVMTAMVVLWGCDAGEDGVNRERVAQDDADQDFVADSESERDAVVEEVDEAPSTPSGNDELVLPRRPFLAVDGFDSEDCGYALVETTTSDYVRAVCNDVTSSYNPVSGGCWTNTTANLRNSFPDEGVNNGPDSADPWSAGQGWSCKYSAAPGAGDKHIAFVLCCHD